MKASVFLVILALGCGCTHETTNDEENTMDTATRHDAESYRAIEHSTMVYRKIKHDEEVLAKLKNSVRGQLRKKNSQLLASTLCAGGSSNIKRHIKEQVNMFFDNYEPQLIEDILRDAIDNVLGCQAVSKVVDLLWMIYQEGNQCSFELMLRSQLQLYKANSIRSLKEEQNFQRKFAFNLYKIKQSKMYHSLDGFLKQQVDQCIAKLPTTLQYLLFHPHFCLMSPKYSEYIYTAMPGGNIDASSRYIWVWHEKLKIDDTGHIKAITFESNIGNTTQLLVQLKGTKYDLFYYLMPQSRFIGGWQLPSEPMNYIWNVEFIGDDRVAFYQDDYIMCSTDEKHDGERRQVRGYKTGQYNMQSSECQWLLGSCDRTRL